MQTVLNNSSFGMPYWDWIRDGTLPDATRSQIWTDAYLGPSGDETLNWAVPSGSFCGVQSPTCQGNWTVPWGLGGPFLERELGRILPALPTQQQASNVLSVRIYDSNPYDDTSPPQSAFRSALEGAGGPVYGYDSEPDCCN